MPKERPKGMGSFPMTILPKSQAAVAYYENLRRKKLPSGWEKLVCTNGQTCCFVHSDYEPQGEELVFKLETRNFQTLVQLYRKP